MNETGLTLILQHAKDFSIETKQIQYWFESLNDVKTQISVLKESIESETKIYETLGKSIQSISKGFSNDIAIYSEEPSNLNVLFKNMLNLMDSVGKSFTEDILMLNVHVNKHWSVVLNDINLLKKSISDSSNLLMNEIKEIKKHSMNLQSRYEKLKSELEEAHTNKKKLENDPRHVYNVTVKEKAEAKILDLINEIQDNLPVIEECSKELTNKKEYFNRNMRDTFELVISSIFKNNIKLNQTLFVVNKEKFEILSKLKTVAINTIRIIRNVDLQLNDFVERKFAEKKQIYFESIDSILITDKDVNYLIKISDSLMNYSTNFYNCMKIRKRALKVFSKMFWDYSKSEEIIASNYSKVNKNIILLSENLQFIPKGSLKNFNLFKNSYEMNFNIHNNFAKYLSNNVYNLILHFSRETKSDYVMFLENWTKKSKDILSYKNILIKYLTSREKIQSSYKEIRFSLNNNKIDQNKYDSKFKSLNEEENNLKKSFEESGKKISLYLNDSLEYLKKTIKIIREKEYKRLMTLIDTLENIIKYFDKIFDQNVDSSKLLINCSASIDIYEDTREIFENYFTKFKINKSEGFLEKIIRKILKKSDFKQMDNGENPFTGFNMGNMMITSSLSVKRMELGKDKESSQANFRNNNHNINNNYFNNNENDDEINLDAMQMKNGNLSIFDRSTKSFKNNFIDIDNNKNNNNNPHNFQNGSFYESEKGLKILTENNENINYQTDPNDLNEPIEANDPNFLNTNKINQLPQNFTLRQTVSHSSLNSFYSSLDEENIEFINNSNFKFIDAKNPYHNIKENDLKEYMEKLKRNPKISKNGVVTTSSQNNFNQFNSTSINAPLNYNPYLQKIDKEVNINEFNSNSSQNNFVGSVNTVVLYENIFALESNETVIDNFSCAYSDKILLQGKLYITNKKLVFNSWFNNRTLFGQTKLVIPLTDIEKFEKKYTLKVFDNSIRIVTKKSELFFTSFVYRDACFNLIQKQWEEVKNEEKLIKNKLENEEENEENLNLINNNSNNKVEDKNKNTNKNMAMVKSNFINKLLKKIEFYSKLEKLHQERLREFENSPNKYREESFFKKIYYKDEPLGNIPLPLVYLQLFDRKTICEELEANRTFIESVFVLRNDYDISYEQPDEMPIPKFYEDLEYFTSLFCNIEEDSMNNFLDEIKNWPKHFKFVYKYTHPIKKKIIGPDRIPMKEDITVSFISPKMFVLEIVCQGFNFPYADSFVSITQWRFNTDYKYKPNEGIFKFMTTYSVMFQIHFTKSCFFKGMIEDEGNKESLEGLKFNYCEKIRTVLDSQAQIFNELFEKVNEENLRKTKNNFYQINEDVKGAEENLIKNEFNQYVSDSEDSVIENNSGWKITKVNDILIEGKNGFFCFKTNFNFYKDVLLFISFVIMIYFIFSKINFKINFDVSFDKIFNVVVIVLICVLFYRLNTLNKSDKDKNN